MSLDTTRPGLRHTLLAAILLTTCSALATAQATQADGKEPPPPAGTSPAFVIQSDNGDNRLQIGGFVHMDGRFGIGDDQQHIVDTFTVRRLRSMLQGRLYRHFEFYFNVELAGGTATVRDAYFDTILSKALRVRVGKMKSPLSYDVLIADSAILFVERGLPTTVAPDRDTGIQVLGDLPGGIVSYAGFIGDGPVDGGSTELDTNEAKEFVGRIVVRPWGHVAKHPLSTLGVAIAATTTHTEATALPSFSTPGRQTFFAYNGAVGEGARHRWSPQLFYYRGPFGAYAEYVHSEGTVRKGTAAPSVAHEAFEVVGSWVLTGEAAGERNVRPRVLFNPQSGNWGALQVVGRYQGLSVSPSAVGLGLAAAGASRTARGSAIGLNWYLAPNIKWNLDIEHTVFDHDPNGPRHAENVLLLRAQFQL